MSEKWTEEAKRERNNYMKQWRKRNRERVRDSQRRYWQRRAQKSAGKFS